MNVGSFLSAAAARDPDRIAVTCSGRQVSYRELDRRVDALGQGLARLGLEAGDRVVLWLYNSLEFVEALFACWKSGLVAVPVNARLLPQEVAFHAEDCAAGALIHGPEFAGAAGTVPVARRIGTAGTGDVGYDDLVQANLGAGDQTREVPDDGPAWLFYTSGTTGRPKGAILTHGNLTFVTVGWCADFYCLQPEDVVLHCAPLSHGAGFHALVAVARGAHNVVQARFRPATFYEAVAAHRVTATWLVPTQIRLLLDEADDDADLSSLRCIVYGGSPMYVQDLKEALARFGPVLCQLYGQGESPMTITYLRREEHVADRPDQEVLTSVGIPRTGMQVRIADDADREVDVGQAGEILVRGPAVMAGYLGRPEATAEALRGGWLHTGDLGRRDERGFVYVLDRLKDVIITGGSNVYAREVEDVLLAHPQIRDATVFGVPHRTWGEAVTAVVVADAGVSEGDVASYCRQRLADYKRPKQVHLADRLPRNAYGKVMKRALRESYG